MNSTARFVSTGFLLLLGAAADAGAGSLTPELEQALRDLGPDAEVPVIATLAERADLTVFAGREDRSARRARVVRALREKAGRTQGPLLALLRQRGARDLRSLWINNSIAFGARADVLRELAAREEVGAIGLDTTLGLEEESYAASATPEWSLAAIRAPELWSLGHGGSGVVVATMDTGVDPYHPDLDTKWRGGSNSWFDPYGENALPRDPFGHGTQVMGILVGGDAGGTAIGVAPFARWIAVKIFDDGGWATLSAIHAGFQWLLDPDGDPATDDAPDVVNNSWGLPNTVNRCNTEFAADISALRTAEISVVFAGGNSGPDEATSVSPANDPWSLAVGATNESSVVADLSSRGPSACDGLLYPGLVAPGVNVRTSDLTGGGTFPDSYAYVTGTSFAAPHVSGAIALLLSAFPQASVADLETALEQGALDLGPAGADNAYGYGLVDLVAAHDLLAAAGSPPTITSTPVTTATEGSLYSYQVTASDPEGTAITFSLGTAPAGMAIDAAGGLVGWTPDGTQVGDHLVVLRATDGSGLYDTQSFTVTVAAINHAPVASDDGWDATAGVTLGVAAPGVLANDSDPDGDPLTAALASGPAHGALVLAADGSFSYTADAAFSGTDSFTYAASDGELASEPATVTLWVTAANQPPVATDDSFTAPFRKTASYTPQVLRVLANDGDPDGSLDPATVRIVTAPDKGGTATVNADGTLSYTPKQRFKGKESFTYDVADDRGAPSNVATVTVTVK
jgi:subtilisin family serine protease